MILCADIGYSNINVIYGECGEKNPIYDMMPATATKVNSLSLNISTFKRNDNLKIVKINNEEWVVGISPTKIQDFARQMHKEFTYQDQWMAMLKAVISIPKKSVIDILTIGLPTEQFYEDDRKEKIIKAIEKTHDITDNFQVTVKKVEILPQSVAPWIDLCAISNEKDLELLKNGRVLVIDPGFYSVDSALFSSGEFFDKSSKTFLWGVSKILEETDEKIHKLHKNKVGIERLEMAIKDNKDIIQLISKKIAKNEALGDEDKISIMAFGQELDITNFLFEAASNVSNNAISSIAQSVRSAGVMDVVLAAGGGSIFYEKSILNLFPESKFILMEDPVYSIVRGYWFFSQAKCRRLLKNG